MLAKELLDILVCPETKQPVKLADAALVVRINERIQAGSIKNLAGQPVSEPIEGGLVREDGAVLYPVRNDIPVMLAEEGIPLEGVAI
jgi:uncharacterized protein YbaR (Trm112 family)